MVGAAVFVAGVLFAAGAREREREEDRFVAGMVVRVHCFLVEMLCCSRVNE